MRKHVSSGTSIAGDKRTSLNVDCSRRHVHPTAYRVKVATPKNPDEETSAVWEAIELRKREKAELEEAVIRKEAVAGRETHEVKSRLELCVQHSP